jgi:DNA (cytosine-5)-methyltransferase 1
MRVGSLFTGYGGLDMAVEHHFGARTVWACDNDPGAARIIAHRMPGVPNLGDITKIDWSAMKRGGDARGSLADIDVLAGGFP